MKPLAAREAGSACAVARANTLVTFPKQQRFLAAIKNFKRSISNDYRSILTLVAIEVIQPEQRWFYEEFIQEVKNT
ncbi:hypothetical protein NDU88_002453 [Pleurodeles waltl]|uniref:Uncharacterized protein n=1 Tax=Pleurodeles waltl TaxID=8319 RepID=A0AAV7UYQ1_PLEWA|nr:hypothetical protein NDU88_002453 [Pleurodeles waltl]